MGTSLKTDESYTVLVVDDDPNIVNIIQTDLEQAGLQVVSASDGEAACILVASIHPDLVRIR